MLNFRGQCFDDKMTCNTQKPKQKTSKNFIFILLQQFYSTPELSLATSKYNTLLTYRRSVTDQSFTANQPLTAPVIEELQ